MTKWDGENSMEIRRRSDERRGDKLASEQEAEEPACPQCGAPLRSFEGFTLCSECGRTWCPL